MCIHTAGSVCVLATGEYRENIYVKYTASICEINRGIGGKVVYTDEMLIN